MRQKNIEELLKCDTINMQNLYRFGYYDCLVAAQIMKYPLKKLESYDIYTDVKNSTKLVSYAAKKLQDKTVKRKFKLKRI